MIPEFDLFLFFRTTLFIFVGIYSTLTMISGLRRLWELFTGDDPHKEMLRVYVSYQLLTIHTSRMRGELAHITLRLLLLALIWRLHAFI